MSYNNELKNKALVKIAKNINISDIVNELGISKSTLYRWKNEHLEELEMIKASLQIKELSKNKEYQKAYELASEERFKDQFLIQSQRITCLIKLGKIEEAYELASEERFKNFFAIQSQRIICLIKLGKKEEAYELASEERFKNYSYIKSQKDYLEKQLLRAQKVSQEVSFDSIFRNLINKRIDIAFKLLKDYLKKFNSSHLEFLIIDLIKLSVLESDGFTTPMMFLTLISRNEYTFNINNFIASFYDAINHNRVKEAEIYLDIIIKGRILTPIDDKFIFDLKEKLRKAKTSLSLDSKQSEFNNQYYGIADMENIFIMVLEENISIDYACALFRLTFEETLIAKILLAREYYAEGQDYLAEKLLKEVSEMPNISRRINSILNVTVRNKKLYRNKGSIRLHQKDN